MKLQHFLFLALLILTVLPAGPNALAQSEPTIAPEIGRLISEEGIDAAKARFVEMAKSDSLDFNAELSGLSTLMGAYMQAGNNEAAEAVANMNGQLAQSMMSGFMDQGMPGMGINLEELKKAEQERKNLEEAQERRNREEEQRLEQERLARARGKSRDDLDRFSGLYGEKKTIFVMPSCDGYLVAGPMWADVSPWWMRSASEMVFTYADSFQNLSMEFELDEGDGTYVMKHDLEGISSPLKWEKEMPSEWGQCIERPRR